MAGVIGNAVIPVAGLGTRLMPLTAAVPKALLPLVDAQCRVRPVTDWIVREAFSAPGIQRVALVVSPAQREMLRRYFEAAGASWPRLAKDVRFIVQEEPKGFGDAVARAEEFAAGEPFMVMLGDHVHVPDAGAASCAAQLAGAFERHGGAAMIGVQTVGCHDLPLVGAAGGESLGEGLYRCRAFIEKPDAATARAQLRTDGLAEDEFLAHSGMYAFTSEIFDCLRQAGRSAAACGAEVALADAQSLLLHRHPSDYYLLRTRGRAYDTGTAESYARALEVWRTVHSERP